MVGFVQLYTRTHVSHRTSKIFLPLLATQKGSTMPPKIGCVQSITNPVGVGVALPMTSNAARGRACT